MNLLSKLLLLLHSNSAVQQLLTPDVGDAIAPQVGRGFTQVVGPSEAPGDDATLIPHLNRWSRKAGEVGGFSYGLLLYLNRSDILD